MQALTISLQSILVSQELSLYLLFSFQNGKELMNLSLLFIGKAWSQHPQNIYELGLGELMVRGCFSGVGGIGSPFQIFGYGGENSRVPHPF